MVLLFQTQRTNRGGIRNELERANGRGVLYITMDYAIIDY
jgi:hypothetical protein